MPIDTRYPAWLAQMGWTQSDAVSHNLQTGYQLGQRNRELAMREREAVAMLEFRGSQLRSMDAYRQTQINTQLMKQKQMEAEQTDAALVTEWMQDPRQPAPTGLRTPKGLKAVADVQKAFAATEVGNHFAAVTKSYTDKIKDLDATSTLRVQQLLDASEGKITPEIATLIDTETARIKGSMAGTEILNEMGEPLAQGGTGKPTFIRSLKTGALHKLPTEWSGEAIPLTDVDNNVIGYGVRNASGGITQLRQEKAVSTTITPERRAAMNLEFKTVQSWWDGLDSKQKAKPENQAELKRKIAEVEGKYSATPAAAPMNDDFQKTYDALPSGARYTAPDGTLRTKR